MRSRLSGATHVVDLRLGWRLTVDAAGHVLLKHDLGGRAALSCVVCQPRTMKLLLVRCRTWLERAAGHYADDDPAVVGVRWAMNHLERWLRAYQSEGACA